MSEQQRYPLSWPTGWKRTSALQRERATFGKTVTKPGALKPDNTRETVKHKGQLNASDATIRLDAEIERLGGTEAVLSTNLRLRLDGVPRSDQGEPFDPGAAVYFRLKGKPRCLACDKWDRVADNIAALAQHIDALRRIERYGVGTMEQAFAGYAQLQASPSDWWIVLEVTSDATTAQIDDAFRRLAKLAHPDAGGSHEQMARLNAARDIAKAQGR
jgi:DnaJ-like protein